MIGIFHVFRLNAVERMGHMIPLFLSHSPHTPTRTHTHSLRKTSTASHLAGAKMFLLACRCRLLSAHCSASVPSVCRAERFSSTPYSHVLGAAAFCSLVSIKSLVEKLPVSLSHSSHMLSEHTFYIACVQWTSLFGILLSARARARVCVLKNALAWLWFHDVHLAMCNIHLNVSMKCIAF